MRELKRAAIIVKPSLIHGYGVFADEFIQKGTIIEECYCLRSAKDQEILDLNNYYFENASANLIPLGFGCIYNHSSEPNAEYFSEDAIITYQAKQHIAKGSEIFISYGKEWFNSRQLPNLSLHEVYKKQLKTMILRFITVAIVIILVASHFATMQ